MREQTANGQTHLDYIDFLNIFACFGVICLHCSGAVFHFEESRLWFISMFVQTVCRACVFYGQWGKSFGIPRSLRYQNIFQKTVDAYGCTVLILVCILSVFALYIKRCVSADGSHAAKCGF